jgi:hypothetical protein
LEAKYTMFRSTSKRRIQDSSRRYSLSPTTIKAGGHGGNFPAFKTGDTYINFIP